MMMNLIILRKKWSSQNRTGRTGSAATVLHVRCLFLLNYNVKHIMKILHIKQIVQ